MNALIIFVLLLLLMYRRGRHDVCWLRGKGVEMGVLVMASSRHFEYSTQQDTYSPVFQKGSPAASPAGHRAPGRGGRVSHNATYSQLRACSLPLARPRVGGRSVASAGGRTCQLRISRSRAGAVWSGLA